MNELELCKAIAKIEGLTLTYSSNIGGWSSGTPYGKDDYEYNPLINKVMLFDLMVKHGVVVKPHSGGFTDVFIDDYKILVVCATDDEIPRAILECILEANQ